MADLHRPSPAVAFVGRHNSGKTTLLVKVIAELVDRGIDVATVKHHGHPGFEIDIPGKDSYRHREAGSSDTVIISQGKMARVTDLDRDLECNEVVDMMPNHDLVIVEGYRQSGLDVIEVMRAANERDVEASKEYCETGTCRGAKPVAVVTDMPHVAQAAEGFGARVFGINDVIAVSDFLQENYARPRMAIVVQAGGESRRMGQSKATVAFMGRPLLARILERVAPAADELIVTTNEPEKLGFIDELDLGCSVKLVTDKYNQRGALPGFCTALSSVTCPIAAVIACDMIFASAQLVSREAYVLHNEKVDAVVPHNTNGYEPFHGVYRVSTCLPAIERAIADGKQRARDFFDDVEVRPFVREEVIEAMPHGGCFTNANTPDELHRLEKSIIEDGDR